MIGAEAAIAKGYAAYQKGDLNTARSTLTPVDHPHAWHILGLVERRADNYPAAANWLNKAAEADPSNPEIANNQGRVSLDAGNPPVAEQCFRRALVLKPDWEPALNGLARSLNAQSRWAEALPLWDQVIMLNPTDPGARYNAAMAALEIGQVEDAAEEYTDLIDAGIDEPAVYFMRSRARLELADIEGGLSDLKVAWAAEPQPHVLKNLANALWMSGDKDGFERVLSDVPENLSLMAVDVYSQSGDLDGALERLAALPEDLRNSERAHALKATIHRERGDGTASLEAALMARAKSSGNSYIDDALISAQLMVGDSEGALASLRSWREMQPTNQHWIAHEMTALRLAGDPDYRDLAQIDAFVRSYELAVPAGYESIEAFNAALMAAIEPVRGFTTHPLDQSLRLGVQTSRDLATMPDPIIQSYIRALDAPIRSYLTSIGSKPGHPFTGRNRGDYKFNGCWSVELTGGGRHVNHVHTNGWISSAYYAAVPAETKSGDSKAGWIKFGEPPYLTSPVCQAEKWVQPKPGTLVLFPSYMWHGTEPILDGSTRVTVPFDLVPA